MKRRTLEQHLKAHGCHKLGEGGNHTRWIAANGSRSTVPRHREIDHRLARNICRQLGISPPPSGR